MQEFGEQNPLLCKQLGDAVAKLTELQRHTLQQIQDRANRLKKVSYPFSSTYTDNLSVSITCTNASSAILLLSFWFCCFS